MTKQQLISLLLLSFSTKSTFPVTTQLSCLYNPETGQKVALIYDHHYENYYKVRNKHLKAIIKQQCKELTNVVTLLSKKRSPTVFIGEINFWKFDYIKKYRRQAITILAVAEFFRKQLHTCVNNFIFLPYDKRNWIDHLIYNYINFYMGNLEWLDRFLFEGSYCRLQFSYDKYKFKEDLEDRFRGNNDLDELTIDEYLYNLRYCYHKMRTKLTSLSAVKESLLQRITDSYKTITATFSNYVGGNRHKGEHSFHTVAFSEIAQKNNIALLVAMWVFTFAHFDVDLLHYVESTALKSIIVQCGAAHACFLEHVLLQTGYVLDSTYGDDPGGDIIEDQDGKTTYLWVGVTEEEYLDSHLPLGLDKKIVAFFGGE